ncbi:MAG: hypothetical protein N3D78_02365 [Candidatus Aenigmarchaeota archaeon]|nr:hypothetical protein [Candidatus Aenigmarchaeota archaeon]
MKKISETHNPLSVFGFYDGFDFYRIKEKVEVPHEKILEINNNLRVSEEHRIFIFTESGFKEVLAKDVRHGDYLILPSKIDVEERKIEIPNLGCELENGVKEVNFLNEKLAQFFGYCLPSVYKKGKRKSLKIKERDLQVLNEYRRILFDIFGIEAEVRSSRNDGFYEIGISNRYVLEVLKYLRKNLYQIFNSEKEIIKSFLRGLFDVSGRISKNGIEICSDEALFLRLLLLRVGIYSRIFKGDRKLKLVVDASEFQEIGFTSLEKRKELDEILKKSFVKKTLPIRKKKMEELLKNLGIEFRFSSSEGFLTYEELEELCKKYSEVKKIFGNLLNLRFEAVDSIKSYPCSDKLIDIETESSNFLANGYLVHNSTYRIYLRKSKENIRIARLIDAPNLPESEAPFRVTEEGIKDVEEK